MYGNVVLWKTKKQSTVTKSSTFAEYVALSELVSEILYIKEILVSFNTIIRNPVNIYEDNSSVIDIAKNGNFTKNSKHIEIQYHFVNENYEKGIIAIQKIASEENVADLLTKPLGKAQFEKLRNKLNLM